MSLATLKCLTKNENKIVNCSAYEISLSKTLSITQDILGLKLLVYKEETLVRGFL